MLLQAFFPIAFGAADVANIAVCTSVFVNYTRIQRYWEFIFEGEIRGNSVRNFEHNFQFAKWENLSKGTGKIFFHEPRGRSKKRQNNHCFLFRNCVNWTLFLVNLVEKSEDTFVDEATWVGIATEYLLQLFDFDM